MKETEVSINTVGSFIKFWSDLYFINAHIALCCIEQMEPAKCIGINKGQRYKSK